MTVATAPARLERTGARILIIDDSAVARAALSRIVTQSGRFAAVTTASDARQALQAVERDLPDVILLDLELPHTSGIDALPRLIAAAPGAKVLIVSSSAAEGAAVTVRALALGAADTLVKPQAGVAAASFASALLAKLEALAAPVADVPRTPAPSVTLAPFDVIAIGASTGGIHALASLLGAVPLAVRQPILVTQHLPASFSDYFAAQLAVSARRPCEIAGDRVPVAAGRVLVAPGDAHLLVGPGGGRAPAARLSTAPAPTGNLPSVDPMLESLAAFYGPRLLAVVLSGMGRDGLIGARAVRAAGGTVIVQDRQSSVVWGMPGAVAREGLAAAVLPPAQLGSLIARGAAA